MITHYTYDQRNGDGSIARDLTVALAAPLEYHAAYQAACQRAIQNGGRVMPGTFTIRTAEGFSESRFPAEPELERLRRLPLR